MEPLLVTLALSVALGLLVRPRSMARLRQWSDRRTTQESAFQNAIRIAQAGTGGEGAAGAFGTTYRASLGLRLLSTALAPVVVALFHVHGPGLVPGGSEADAVPLLTGGLALAALWYLAFMWRYEVTLERDRITFTSLSLGVSQRYLAGLVAVEDDRAYMLRLFFRDQPQAEVFRMVSGAAEMRARIESHLPEDEAAACQSFRKSRRSAGA